jgi:outer membrane lipoprotein-sorting protein
MKEQRRSAPQRRGAPVARFLMCLLAVGLSRLLLQPAAAEPSQAPDLFDQIYSRGRGIQTSLKTVTATFTETTTSSLLSRPLVAHGTLAVERPARIVLRYATPEARILLIDQGKMTMVWPSRAIRQQTDVAAALGRVDKYFLDKSPNELRRNFDIKAIEADDRPGTWRVTMVPRRKQIQQGITRLELWIDRTSLLLAAMRMTFPNADTKLMAFENVVVNGPLDRSLFSVDR